jgi:hypothetical protein
MLFRPYHFQPWYVVPRPPKMCRLSFGHWSSKMIDFFVNNGTSFFAGRKIIWRQVDIAKNSDFKKIQIFKKFFQNIFYFSEASSFVELSSNDSQNYWKNEDTKLNLANQLTIRNLKCSILWLSKKVTDFYRNFSQTNHI